MKQIKNIFFGKNKLKRSVLITVVSLLAVISVVRAGSLDSPGAPGSTMYTLGDIYQRLTTNQVADEAGHTFKPGAEPASSFYTLKQLYDAIPTIEANKVKLGTGYLGISGTLLPEGGTADASQVLSGKTFFGASQTDWNLKTGTMANIGQQLITPGIANQTITVGYHDGTGYVSGDADLVSGNIKSGITIFGVDGNSNVVNTSSGDAVTGEILSGKKAWADGGEITGTMANNGAFSLTASSTDQSVIAGYYSGGTLAGDADLTAAKIANGVNIFGVVGEYPSATYTLANADATADLAASGGNITSSNGAVEWWQSDGTRQTATLDFPTLSNVCNTDTSNNSAGTLSVTATYLSVGNTWCGTAGTLLANLFNGTSGAFTGGSQAAGGADDYNNAGSAASGRYAMGWTACNAGNNYCGTSDTGADAKDDSTGLIWSMPCNGSGCASFSDSSPLTYSWDNSAANNNSRTSSQLCSDHTGWSLPHQKQLMQAYIDGSYGNLEASGVSRDYWSASTVSYSTTNAWFTYLSLGSTRYNTKTNAYYVRCVR